MFSEVLLLTYCNCYHIWLNAAYFSCRCPGFLSINLSHQVIWNLFGYCSLLFLYFVADTSWSEAWPCLAAWWEFSMEASCCTGSSACTSTGGCSTSCPISTSTTSSHSQWEQVISLLLIVVIFTVGTLSWQWFSCARYIFKFSNRDKNAYRNR